MFLKHYIFLAFCYIISFEYAAGENSNLDEVNLNLFEPIKNIKQSLQILNTHVDVMSDRYSSLMDKNEICEKPAKISGPIFDIRFDSLPEHCTTNSVAPSTCTEATECTRTSGVYNIIDVRYSNQTFMVYCDYEYDGGEWIYILTRFNGKEDFNRTWNEYVNGFGNVAKEYWLGLERLYALTNYYEQQELNVYIENFEGIAKYARYSDFVIGNASEKYKLKSLGDYSGTAGNSMSYELGNSFSTYDNDNDMHSGNCGKLRGGGFWFNDCGIANPTGLYKSGTYNGYYNGCFWSGFSGKYYSHKTIVFMIRRSRAIK